MQEQEQWQVQVQVKHLHLGELLSRHLCDIECDVLLLGERGDLPHQGGGLLHRDVVRPGLPRTEKGRSTREA